MKSSRVITLFLLMLVLPVLACNTVTNRFVGPEPAQGLLATEPPVQAPGGDDGSGEFAEPAGPESLDLATLASGLQDVNSYRVTIEIRAEGVDGSGSNDTATIFMENATVVDPPAAQTDITIESPAESLDLNALQFIAVEGTVYTTLPGIGCFSGGVDALGDEIVANPFADIFASSDIIGDVRGARRVLPDETINGVASYHFVFDESALQDPDNNLEQVDGHIYIAKEEGYVVRLVMDGTGRVNVAGLGQESAGTIQLEMNTHDVNEPIDIQPPADCDTFNLDEFELPNFDLDLDATTTP